MTPIAPTKPLFPATPLPLQTRSLDVGPDTDAALLAVLREKCGEEVVTSWFGRLQIDKIDGALTVVSVPTTFLRSWLKSHYAAKLLEAVRTLAPEVAKLDIVIRSAALRSIVSPKPPPSTASPQLAPADPKPIPTPALGPTFSGSPLDPRLTFATFHTGRSNRLAHAAALQVGESEPGKPAFNPLYVHGAVGLGKTHLLQAVAHAAATRDQRVLYMSAEKFMYGFVLALRMQASHSFRDRLRDIDVLIVDDVQFLQGKSVQQEFRNIVALVDARKQLIVAADRSPVELEALEDRARSRLGGGLCVEVGALDQDIRVKLLESRVASAVCKTPWLVVPDDVIAYVASAVQTNGRDLEGAVNRLIAQATLTQAALTVASAEVAIRDLVRMREPKRVKIDDIQKLVAAHYNVSRADIMSQRRSANVVRPRQIAMYLSKLLTPRSLPEIGRRFGGRDHTTVLHAVRKMEGLAISDHALGDEIKTLRAMLEDA